MPLVPAAVFPPNTQLVTTTVPPGLIDIAPPELAKPPDTVRPFRVRLSFTINSDTALPPLNVTVYGPASIVTTPLITIGWLRVMLQLALKVTVPPELSALCSPVSEQSVTTPPARAETPTLNARAASVAASARGTALLTLVCGKHRTRKSAHRGFAFMMETSEPAAPQQPMGCY